MPLFTCCAGRRKQQEKSAAEARHARIIEIYNQARMTADSRAPTQASPPAYEEVVYDAFSGTIIVVGEKSPAGTNFYQSDVDVHPARIRRPESPQTSIFSVPSTRLTDITSAHTGGTVVADTHRGDSPRSSLVFDSAPPSYWDGRSLRERSPSPASQRGLREGEQHPVMSENWLEHLLARVEQDTPGENATQRR